MIDWIKNIDTAQTEVLGNAIEHLIPYGISAYTYMETLQGVRRDQDYAKVSEYLASQRIYFLPESLVKYDKAAKLYSRLRKQGVTPRGSIDVLIALAAIENNLVLLHNDNDFELMSEKIPELRTYK